MKLYMFRTVPLSIIRSFSLYTQQWYMLYRFADSLRAGSGWTILILHHDKFLKIKPTIDALISQIYFCMKVYMFWTVPLSIIRSFLLYTQQWYM